MTVSRRQAELKTVLSRELFERKVHLGVLSKQSLKNSDALVLKEIRVPGRDTSVCPFVFQTKAERAAGQIKNVDGAERNREWTAALRAARAVW